MKRTVYKLNIYSYQNFFLQIIIVFLKFGRRTLNFLIHCTSFHISVANERFTLSNSSWKSRSGQIRPYSLYCGTCINLLSCNTSLEVLNGSFLEVRVNKRVCVSDNIFGRPDLFLSDTDPVSWNFNQTFLKVVRPILRALLTFD